MSSLPTGLTPLLSAEIFGTLALRLDAFETFVSGDRFGMVQAESGERSFLESGRLAELLEDRPLPAVSSFLKELSSGRFHDHRYRTREGDYTPASKPVVRLPVSQIVVRQQPASPTLSTPSGTCQKRDIPLTVPWVFLENFSRISAGDFIEAAFRALGHRVPEQSDMLWLHAGGGEVGTHAVSSSLVLSESPPPVSARDYRNHPRLFPLVCLDYERAWWRVYPHRTIGDRETKQRILPFIFTIANGIAIGQTRHSGKKAVAKPASVRPLGNEPVSAKRLRLHPYREHDDPSAWPLADIFSKPDAERFLRGRANIIAITQVNIPVGDLNLIPGYYFHLALNWCLGIRDPREGDVATLIAGPGFSRKGKIRDCLLVSPTVPASRGGDDYPKVRMLFTGGRWTILPQELTGQGSKELMEIVLLIKHWNLSCWK